MQTPINQLDIGAVLMTKILTTVKKVFGGTGRKRFVTVASGFTCLIAMATSTNATQFKEARVTQVVNDVKLLLQQAAPRPAAVGDLVRTGTAVRTGSESRSELTFADLTITRLGANTIFSFNPGTREMNLVDGAILFRCRKARAARRSKPLGSPSQSPAPLGSANFIPPKPATLRPSVSGCAWKERSTFICLTVNRSSSVPGKWSPQTARAFRKVLDFDIGQLVETSLFFVGFDTKLASLDLIALEIQKQLDLTLAGGFAETATRIPSIQAGSSMSSPKRTRQCETPNSAAAHSATSNPNSAAANSAAPNTNSG